MSRRPAKVDTRPVPPDSSKQGAPRASSRGGCPVSLLDDSMVLRILGPHPTVRKWYDVPQSVATKAREVANWRDQRKRDRGQTGNEEARNRDRVWYVQRGIVAEYIVSHVWSCSGFDGFKAFLGAGRPYDLISPSGARLDVKSIDHRNNDTFAHLMQFDGYHDTGFDVFVLASVDRIPLRVRLLGWVPREEFFERCYRHPFFTGAHVPRVLHWSELRAGVLP